MSRREDHTVIEMSPTKKQRINDDDDDDVSSSWLTFFAIWHLKNNEIALNLLS